MKTLRIAALILLFATTSPATHFFPAQDSADVTVTRISWKKYEHRGVLTWGGPEFRAETKEMDDMAGAAPPRSSSSARGPAPSQNDSENSQGRLNKPASNPGPKLKMSRPMRENAFEGYEYKATFKNSGRKTVKSITWSYLFIDPNSGKEAGRHSFISEKKISPGKEADLAGLSRSAPTIVVSADKDFEEKAVIERIVFTDGSEWARPAEEPAKDAPVKDK